VRGSKNRHSDCPSADGASGNAVSDRVWGLNRVVLVCVALFGCGGHANNAATGSEESSSRAATSAPESGSPSMLSTLPQEAQPGAFAGHAGAGGAGIGGSPSDQVGSECVPDDEFTLSDFVVMSFVNDTSATLYLASTNAHCGAWPAFVEFSRDGAGVDLYVGDCVPDPCPTPFRAVAPGESVYQFVFPWRDTHYELRGSCIWEGTEMSVACNTTSDLPDGTYSLRATAYRELDCGDSCNCDRNGMLDWCTSPDGTQPRGVGVAIHADAVLEHERLRLGQAASLTFSD
jgi:hypothetical protein